MVDYSRAATSRAAKSSFDQAAQSLIAEIQALQEEYETEWKKVEDLRRSRASLIENVIPILKSNEVKLARPLSKCDNNELMEELSKTVNSLDTTPQEEVKVAMVRIESRYDQLVKQAKKLDALYERLSSYYVPEKDYGDEVVISLKGKKKKKDSQGNSSKTNNLESSAEQVMDLKTDEILDMPVTTEAKEFLDQLDASGEEQSLGEYFSAEDSNLPIDLDVAETPVLGLEEDSALGEIASAFEVANDKPKKTEYAEFTNDGNDMLLANGTNLEYSVGSNYLGASDAISDDFNIDNLGAIFKNGDLEEEYKEAPKGYADDGYEQVVSSTPASQELIDEVESLIDSKKLFDYLDHLNMSSGNDYVEEYVSLPQDEPSEGEPEFHTYSLNSSQTFSQIVDYVYEGNLTWYDIYRYADNEDLISKRCEELGIDIEDAANTQGALADLDIKYPKNFVPYEEQSVGYGKAA